MLMARYATHLHEALTGLVADPEEGVRAQLAAGYAACSQLLGRDRSLQYMKRCGARSACQQWLHLTIPSHIALSAPPPQHGVLIWIPKRSYKRLSRQQ